MIRFLRSLFFFIVVVALTQLQSTAAAKSCDIKTEARVVVFADVHGAYEELVSLLTETGMVDSALNWTGGDAHLVSLGDLIDRGPGSRDVIDLMIKLQAQAPKDGGEVHVLLGNHEIMVMTGDLRYVTEAEYRAFAGDETDAERDNLRKEYRADHNNGDNTNTDNEFNKLFPPGFIALNKAFSPDGYIGKWLLDQHVVLKINDTVFVHAGISSENVKKSLNEINGDGKSELKGYLDVVDQLRNTGVLPLYPDYYDRVPYLNKKAQALIDEDPEINSDNEKRPGWFDGLTDLYDAHEAELFGTRSPVWYRGTAGCHVYTESFNVERFLKNVNAKRLVIGHTPTVNRRAIERMDGLVIMLDTGMLKDYYRGQASALILEKENIYVRYPGNPENMKPVREQRSLSINLSGMSDSELEEFLSTAEVTDIKDIGTGITKPKKITLSKDGKTINAIFKSSDTHPGLQQPRNRYTKRAYAEADREIYDVAAYHLDRLMDLQMIPPVVLREIDGKEGVLQYWVEDSIDERDREKFKIPFESNCKKSEQYWLRFIFDILIYNEDRNLTNILWLKKDFRMLFIDHSRAFRISTGRPKQYRGAPLYVSDILRKKLQDLNSENLTLKLSPYLNPLQISAILKRRDLILKRMISTD